MKKHRRQCLVAILILSLPIALWAGSTVQETAKGQEPGETKRNVRDVELDLRRTIAVLRDADADTDSIEPAPIWERPHEAEKDRRNLELNLRWIITRLRSTNEHKPATVGVYADAGTWYVGAKSIVEA